MLHRGQTPARGVEHVHPRDVDLRVVARRAQTALTNLVEGGLEDIGPVAEELEAVGPLVGFLVDPLTRLLGGGERLVAPLAEDGVSVDPRRGDGVGVTLLAVIDAEVETVAARRIADRRDAVPHPQLEDVFGGRALALAADVAVHVDEAGQHVVPRQVDLVAVLAQLGPSLGVGLDAGIADRLHVDDGIALDDDVDRSDRRRAGAVDQRRAAQDQAFPRTFAFALGTRRRRLDRRTVVILGGRLGGAVLLGGAERHRETGAEGDQEGEVERKGAGGSGRHAVSFEVSGSGDRS